MKIIHISQKMGKLKFVESQPGKQGRDSPNCSIKRSAARGNCDNEFGESQPVKIEPQLTKSFLGLLSFKFIKLLPEL